MSMNRDKSMNGNKTINETTKCHIVDCKEKAAYKLSFGYSYPDTISLRFSYKLCKDDLWRELKKNLRNPLINKMIIVPLEKSSAIQKREYVKKENIPNPFRARELT